MGTKPSVQQIGCDCHRKFSKVTARDRGDRIVWRERLEHRDRQRLREQLERWPRGTPVVLEATFGWGWLSDELEAAGLDPRLASSSKVAAWRRARGLAKSNRTDADLLSELWSQKPRWWEVWLAPPEVREQREWLRYRMTLVKRGVTGCFGAARGSTPSTNCDARIAASTRPLVGTSTSGSVWPWIESAVICGALTRCLCPL